MLPLKNMSELTMQAVIHINISKYNVCFLYMDVSLNRYYGKKCFANASYYCLACFTYDNISGMVSVVFLLLLFNLILCLLKCIKLMKQILSGSPMCFQNEMMPWLSVWGKIYCFKSPGCGSDLKEWKWKESEKYNVALGMLPSPWLII